MSKTRESCHCPDCTAACKHRPGWFKPGEAEELARAEGKTLQELFDDKLAVDWWNGDRRHPNTVFVLAPATPGHEGDQYPADPRNQCSLYDGGCTIHENKPFECQTYLHDDSKKQVMDRRLEVVEAWDTQEHQQLIRDLLGQEPVAKAFDSFGLGGMLHGF